MGTIKIVPFLTHNTASKAPYSYRKGAFCMCGCVYYYYFFLSSDFAATPIKTNSVTKIVVRKKVDFIMSVFFSV